MLHLTHRQKLLAWLALAAAVIAADQVSKAWLLTALSYGEQRVITPFFNLVLVGNTGAAFSFLSGAGGWQRWLFAGLAIIISGWIIAMLNRHAAERLLPLALSLVLGGALGNLADRFTRGAVIDFLDFHAAGWHFWAFNVADSAISIGVALMLWQQLMDKPPS